jgi:hypothetical protein
MQSRIDSQKVAAGSGSKKEHGMKSQRMFVLTQGGER